MNHIPKHPRLPPQLDLDPVLDQAERLHDAVRTQELRAALNDSRNPGPGEGGRLRCRTSPKM